ncbi:RNA polymerase sigma factor [Paenibacillus oenotherae]|uniref:RNA polymerase sigma factor n=1 Tax=Paenibacillus oenotherae TaxID=1435645 RepID=A0ABS7D4C5_9BACL|nr:RNA polymerase sigma factor [Paenibacillus oenotherae]MBW7474706.1 RNA polymerase sigma factor [Paenibacillus oenotherae]
MTTLTCERLYAIEGSQQEYEALITPHLSALHKYCSYLTQSKWDQEDLVQETLYKSYAYYLRNPLMKDAKSFLLCIARNTWIDQYRRVNNQRTSTVFWHEPATYIDSDYAEVISMLEWLSERLPERNIRMWLLAEYFDYSMQEIADEMNTTMPTVKSVLFRTRELLRGKKKYGRHKVIQLNVERWCKAVMQERPQGIVQGS